MMETIIVGRRILAAAMLLSVLLLSGCYSAKCYLGSYSGRILDMESGQPIEGAVFHVTYTSYGASAAGAIGTPVAVREDVTGADGEYHIPEEGPLASYKCVRKTFIPGSIQFFKPGYGYIGKARKSCPEEEKEKVHPSDKEPRCLTIEGKYLIWELPRLKTYDEKRLNLGRIRLSYIVPYEKERNLRNAINIERVNLGIPPLSGVKPGENNED